MDKITDEIWNGEYYQKSFYKRELQKFLKKSIPNLSETKDNFKRIQLLRNSLSSHELQNFFSNEGPVTIKSATISTTLRTQANSHYKCRRLDLALRGYNLAICYAPQNSEELTLSFSNRSACFLELGRVQDCLKDIELIESLTEDKNNNILQKKLQERKQKCLDKIKRKCESNENICSTAAKNIFKLQNVNDKIESAEDFVTIEDNLERGRHATVTKDVQPGCTIIVEEPFAKILVKQLRWDDRCHHCFQNLFGVGLPCTDCVFAMYCNDECAKLSRTYHQFECAISPFLYRLHLSRIVLLSLRVITKLSPLKAYNFWKSQSTERISSQNEILGFDDKGRYLSSSYYPIYNLIYHDNQESISESELKRYSLESLLICEALDNNTPYFKNLSLNNKDKINFKTFIASLILLHQMNLPCNAHSLNDLKLASKVNSKFQKLSSEEIKTATTIDYGAGAFALLSLINHSCNPNVTRVTLANGKNAVLTIRLVRKGEEIVDNYGAHYALEDKSERQAHLKQNYHFLCSCTACKLTWPNVNTLVNLPTTFTCLHCTVGLSDGQCPNCKKHFNIKTLEKQLENYIDMFNQAYNLVLENRPYESLETLAKCLEFFECNLVQPYLYVNYAQETLKQALNLLAII